MNLYQLSSAADPGSVSRSERWRREVFLGQPCVGGEIARTAGGLSHLLLLGLEHLVQDLQVGDSRQLGRQVTGGVGAAADRVFSGWRHGRSGGEGDGGLVLVLRRLRDKAPDRDCGTSGGRKLVGFVPFPGHGHRLGVKEMSVNERTSARLTLNLWSRYSVGLRAGDMRVLDFGVPGAPIWEGRRGVLGRGRTGTPLGKQDLRVVGAFVLSKREKERWGRRVGRRGRPGARASGSVRTFPQATVRTSL